MLAAATFARHILFRACLSPPQYIDVWWLSSQLLRTPAACVCCLALQLLQLWCLTRDQCDVILRLHTCGQVEDTGPHLTRDSVSVGQAHRGGGHCQPKAYKHHYMSSAFVVLSCLCTVDGQQHADRDCRSHVATCNVLPMPLLHTV